MRRAAIIGASIFATMYAAFVTFSYFWSDGSVEWNTAIAILWTLFGAFLLGLLEWQPLDMPDVSEVALRCEREFGVKLPDDQIGAIVSVDDLYRLLLAAILSQRGDQADEAAIWDKLRTLISNSLGVDKDEVIPSARFLYELA